MASLIFGIVCGRCVAGTGLVAASLLGACAMGPEVMTGSLLEPKGYVLSTVEKSWHCDSLENAIQARVTTIAGLTQKAKSNAEAPAPTIAATFARLTGKPGGGDPTASQIQAERSAIDAYNAALKAKGCATVDVEVKITTAAAPVPVAIPVAEKAAKKGSRIGG